MKVVAFQDGTFAVRRFELLFFGYKYLDIKAGYWWGRDSEFFNDCKTDIDTARKRMIEMQDKGKVVDL